MILFSEIYEKAVNLFDDPDIRKAYVCNKIKFYRKMYAYFQNGMRLFTHPMAIAFELQRQTPPVGEMEIFEGTGDKRYVLSTTPIDGSEIEMKIAGERDDGAFYNSDDNSVTFSKDVAEGTECSVEWYFPGEFETDFSTAQTSAASKELIQSYAKDILARALVLSWAEKEKNFVLDIRNLLTDTDFKIYSPANSVLAKVNWVKDLRFQFDSLQTQLGWMMFGQVRNGGQRYGP